MSYENVIKFCIKYQIKFEQYAFLYLLSIKDFGKPDGESLFKQYLNATGKFDHELILDLQDKGLIQNFNSPNESLPDLYIITPKIKDEMFADEEAEGEELWNSYPSIFKIRGSSTFNFNGRNAGPYGTKEALLAAYMIKIKRSKKKHKFVMEMLDKYKKLVESKSINAVKLGDWVANEMWDSVAEIDEESYGEEFI